MSQPQTENLNTEEDWPTGDWGGINDGSELEDLPPLEEEHLVDLPLEYIPIEKLLDGIDKNNINTLNSKSKLNMFFSKLDDTTYHKNKNIEKLLIFSDNMPIMGFSKDIKACLFYIKTFFEYVVQSNNSGFLICKNLNYLNMLTIYDGLKLIKKAKFVNFKILFNHMKQYIGFDKITQASVLNYSAFNYDDRVFKFCINYYKYVPHDETFFSYLLLHPRKYFFKRLKMISNYLDKHHKLSLFRCCISGSYDENIMNVMFKYYYSDDVIFTEESIYWFVYHLRSLNTVTFNMLKYYFDKLKTTEEKNHFNITCISQCNTMISLKYLNFSNISIDEYFKNYKIITSNYQLDQNKDRSYILNIIITRLHSSIHFKNFLLECKQNNISNSKYYNKSEYYIDVYGYNSHRMNLYMLPYINESKNIFNPKINYLYIKLKRFIHKFRLQKNVRRNILFKPVLFELTNYYRSNNIKLLDDNVLASNNNFNTIPPHLMFPGEIEMMNNYLIKEKADGELVYELPKNITPNFNLNCKVKAEYIEELDLYLVFDCDIDMSIKNRYNALRGRHYITSKSKLTDIDNMKQLIQFINHERELFDKFMDEDYDDYRWYPKAAWNIITMNEEFINSIYDFINEKSPYNDLIINNDYYQNDGFILTPTNGDEEVKVKPKSLMTIDLEYDGNTFIDREKNQYDIDTDSNINLTKGIYRCYPTDTKFMAREIRFDKRKPNPYDVVNNIINLSKINYNIKTPLYYHNVDFKNNQLWKKIVDDNLKNLLNVNNFMYKKESILDLGCGKCKILKMNFDFSNYTGYDYDVYVLLKNMKNKKSNVKFNYIDLSGDWSETKDKFYDVNYNKYMNIYAINSLMHFNTDLFWKQINMVSKKGTRFLFNLLRSDTEKEIFWIQNNSYIKQNKNTIELYFENVHSKPLIEKYITINDVNRYLEKYNFSIIYKYTSSNDNVTDLYDWYVCEKN